MVDYDPFSPEIIRGNPHPVYETLRNEAPAYYLEKWDAWALSRFEDVWNACMDAESFSSAEGSTASHLLTKLQPVTPMLNMMDAPEHPKLRALVKPFFGRKRVEDLSEEVRSFVRERLDAVEDQEVFDVVGVLAQPMATFAASMVSGFPTEDAALLRELVDRFFARDPETEGISPDGLVAMNDMFGYFAQLAATARRTGAGDDTLIGRLLAWEGADGRLDDAAIASHLSLFLVGGIDTLPKVFANTLLRLAENPEQRARVAADPSLALDAFHEALRIDMPTQFMCRKIVKPVEYHGQRMEPGQVLMLLYTSANRDDREFANPETYDLDRRPPRHLGFSHGAHACIGLHTARMEARVALEEILKRFPEYEVLHDEIEHYRTEFVKGFSRMPIRKQAT